MFLYSIRIRSRSGDIFKNILTVKFLIKPQVLERILIERTNTNCSLESKEHVPLEFLTHKKINRSFLIKNVIH